MRNLDSIRKRVDVLHARTRPVVPLVLIDATGFVDEVTYANFAASDAGGRDQIRAELAALEDGLVAEKLADLPVVKGSRVIRAIVVTAALPEEHDVWRLTPEADTPRPDKQAALARRDALIAEAEAEWHREQAQKAPLAERDWNPSGPDEEVLYFEEPSGWPVTRATHRERMGQ